MNRARRRREVQRFSDHLEIILVRVRCGQTLRQAVQGLPNAVPAGPLYDAWRSVGHAVNEGRLGAEPAITSLLQRIRLEERAETFLDRATAPVSGQAKLVGGLSVLFLAAALFLFPPILRPGLGTLAASFIFGAAGFGFQRWLLQRARRGLWLADWVRVLGLWRSRLSWGSTPGQALDALSRDGQIAPLPKPLRERVEGLLQSLRAGASESEALCSKPTNPAETYACEQIDALARLAMDGLPLTELLTSFVESTESRFRNQAEEVGERLKAQALAPLLICHFPSFGILWMGPLLGSLLALGR